MEQSLFNLIITFWEKFPKWFHLSVEICLILILIAILIKYSLPIIKYFKIIFKKKSIIIINKPIQLKDNSIFSQIVYWQCYKINNLDLGDIKRNELFRKIINAHLEVTEKNLKELAENIMLKDVSKTEYKKYILKMFFDIITESNQVLERSMNKEIFNMIIIGDRGFNQWNEECIIYTKNLIEMVCDSDFYKNNDEKTWTLLNIYQSNLDAIILVVEKVFYNFNGDLSKLLTKYC